MVYDWDEKKNTENYRKHSVFFEEAQTVWADPNSREFFDDDHSEDEDRFIKVGYSSRDRILMVVFCERDGDTVRIISSRKAVKSEKRFYEERI